MNSPSSFLSYLALIALYTLTTFPRTDFLSGRETIPLPDCDVSALERCLRETWHIEIPVFTWKNYCVMRISIQGYNSPSDIERLLTALQAIFSSGEQIGIDSKR